MKTLVRRRARTAGLRMLWVGLLVFLPVSADAEDIFPPCWEFLGICINRECAGECIKDYVHIGNFKILVCHCREAAPAPKLKNLNSSETMSFRLLSAHPARNISEF